MDKQTFTSEDFGDYDLSRQRPVGGSHRPEPIATVVRLLKQAANPVLRAGMAEVLGVQNRFNRDIHRTLSEALRQVEEAAADAHALRAQFSEHRSRLNGIFNEYLGRLEQLVTTWRDDAASLRRQIARLNVAHEELRHELGGVGVVFRGAPPGEAHEAERLSAVPREEVASCWVCGSAERRPFGTKDGFELVECAGCRFIYVTPRIPANGGGVLYGKEYWFGHQRELGLASFYDRAAYDYQQALPRIMLAKPFRSSGRWLDCGASNGALVRRANEFGYQGVGLELDPEIAKMAAELFGVKISTGDLNSHSEADGSLGVVSMFDVFEHLHDPDAVLMKVHRWLDAQGVLILETFRTDVASFARDPLHHADTKPAEHVGMYREEHIDRVLGRCGFEVAATRYPNGPDGARILKIARKVASRRNK